MSKKTCLPGSRWDNLVNHCVPFSLETRPQPHTPTELSPIFTPADIHSDPLTALSPVLWAVLMLTTLASILALLVCFVMDRRQSRLRTSSEQTEVEEQPSASKSSSAATGAHHPHPHLHHHQWRDGLHHCDCPGSGRPAREEGGVVVCWPAGEHRVPLPATELGDTALVTTKTV
ncbi:tumor necrosis factor receptor superfamily member 13C-like [Nerophis ophidion]|uniref:tumor necrosis factor receptor superfamily member 13C-like n=1 Tax=Nerophis ophidion TaxID=159077 RepID=UPI002ADFE1A0|nr:tumor necrosis factor receptor superfamily member 13C-like [Nerophis ophidion]